MPAAVGRPNSCRAGRGIVLPSYRTRGSAGNVEPSLAHCRALRPAPDADLGSSPGGDQGREPWSRSAPSFPFCLCPQWGGFSTCIGPQGPLFRPVTARPAHRPPSPCLAPARSIHGKRKDAQEKGVPVVHFRLLEVALQPVSNQNAQPTNQADLPWHGPARARGTVVVIRRIAAERDELRGAKNEGGQPITPTLYQQVFRFSSFGARGDPPTPTPQKPRMKASGQSRSEHRWTQDFGPGFAAPCPIQPAPPSGMSRATWRRYLRVEFRPCSSVQSSLHPPRTEVWARNQALRRSRWKDQALPR